MMSVEETKIFVEKVARDNYEDPKGILYDFYKSCKTPWNELDERVKGILKMKIMECLMLGDIDTRLDEKSNKIVWKLADESLPSDIIIFDNEDDLNKFRKFWKKPNTVYKGTPSDIFFADTIPLKDCCFNLNYNWMTEDDVTDLTEEEIQYLNDNCRNIMIRIVIFDHYNNATKNNNRDTIIGMMIMDLIKKKSKKAVPRIGLPFFISENQEHIVFQIIAYDNIKRDDVCPENLNVLQKTMTKYLDAWYGVQLALLNPITEEVFERKRENPISVKKGKVGLGKKRKIIYTRKYKICAEDIDEVYEERKKNNMSCPLWYVIGHWRQYQDGRRIFIKGYWKGPERERFINKELDAKTIDKITSLTRERKILTEESIE